MKSPKMEGLAHVGIFVQDLSVSKQFYTEKLDFKVTWETTLEQEDGTVHIAFVQNGSLVIELVQFPHPQKRQDGTVDHIAIRVENIEAIRELLAGRGIVFETDDIVHGPGVFANGSKWILFRGPDNEHLEITEAL